MGGGGKGTCRLGYETDLRQLYGHFKFSVLLPAAGGALLSLLLLLLGC
jgi:hypothetical protein